MAIVKANYVKRGKIEKERAKATIRYIQHRPGREGEKTIRTLFGSDGVMERKEADRMIDEALKATTFFRFVISPDPTQEDKQGDLALRDVTQRTMQLLDEHLRKPVVWVGAEHDDHSPNRHVHVVACVPGRIDRAALQTLTREATEACLEQRRELDRAREREALLREEAEWGRGY